MQNKLFLPLFIAIIAVMTCSCSQQYDTDNNDTHYFVGTWNSSRAGKINLFYNGTWRVNKCNFGKWSLRDNNIVWTYKNDSETEDINPILKATSNEFVLKEMDGSETVFKRIK